MKAENNPRHVKGLHLDRIFLTVSIIAFLSIVAWWVLK